MDKITKEITSDSILAKEIRLSIRNQMAQNLNLMLESYRNKDIGLRLISEKMKIGEKTLKRILKIESDPHINTIQSFYHYFYSISKIKSSDHPLYKEISALINFEKLEKDKDLNFQLEELLAEDRVFRKIFLYSRTGFLTEGWVENEFGKFGLDYLSLMLRHNILLEIDKNIYVEGNISIPKGAKALKNIISDLIKDNLSEEKLSEKGSNSAFYVLDGVSDSAFDNVLEITERFKKEIAALVMDKNNRGLKRLFVATAVDTLTELEIKDEFNLEQ